MSDYALRVMMYAASAGDRLVTIEETARTYNISRAHLMKVVNILTRAGYVRSVRGRSGGFTLAKRPEAIVLGSVVRVIEPDFALVECFATGSQCIITRFCKLPDVLNEALSAFIATLDSYTLADIILTPRYFSASGRGGGKARGPCIAAAGAKGTGQAPVDRCLAKDPSPTARTRPAGPAHGRSRPGHDRRA